MVGGCVGLLVQVDVWEIQTKFASQQKESALHLEPRLETAWHLAQ